jgi:hypothetical protein
MTSWYNCEVLLEDLLYMIESQLAVLEVGTRLAAYKVSLFI